MVCYLIMNGWAAAEQNHLGTDKSDKQVLMDRRPVRFGNTVGREEMTEIELRFQQNSALLIAMYSV